MNILNKLHEKLWRGIDGQITRSTRTLAKRVSRRGFVGRLGTLLVGTGALVVGGNVLTSQRVVDVILKAFAVAAASQGCMNNFTFGNDRFGYYETIGGGAGAGAGTAAVLGGSIATGAVVGAAGGAAAGYAVADLLGADSDWKVIGALTGAAAGTLLAAVGVGWAMRGRRA